MVDEKLYRDWSEIYLAVVRKALSLQGQYDCLVAIGTGGFIPAKILREYLRIPCYSITVQSYSPENEQKELEIVQWIHPDYLDGKRVLLVDDIDDTGKTLAFCRERLLTPTTHHTNPYFRAPEERQRPQTLDVFVIDNKQKPKEYLKDGLEIDFQYHFCFEQPGEKWIVYPWERDGGT